MVNRSDRVSIAKWIAILSILMVFCVIPTSAITVTGTRYIGSIPAGGTGTHGMTIGIGQNENPTDVSVEVMGLGQDLDQTYTTIDPRSDTTPYSARTFISLDKTLIHLKPGIPEKVTATITLPKDVGSGGRYASIYIYAVPAQGQIGQTMTTAAIVPVAITISGTTPTITGSITSVDVGEVVVGQPISVTTSFKNTGNYYAVSPINQVKILDLKGNIIANSSTAPSGYAVIPGNTVQYVLKPDAKTLQQGSYTIDSKILLASGKVLDEKMTPFTVKSNYVPPITESNITLTPGSAGTLTSPDSRYSVSFPQGAVLGDAVVTLKPYSNEKLHAAPANAKLGATSFEITGLSGLLSKDATVKVKYSADDLTAAGGDVSKLKLSYYDAAQNAWVILPTQVDSTGMILTTTTNHLSVWAVMVSSSTTGSPASVSAPVATTAKGSPLPLTVILISLAIAVLAAGYHTGKKK